MAQIMYAREFREAIPTPSTHGENWVRQVLEPDQISSTKQRFGRAKLSGGTLVLLWGLRIYVVFMTLLIGLEVWNAVHAGS